MRTIARRGITMMEVAIGTLLVGAVLASTLHLVGPTVRATRHAEDRMLASLLAEDTLERVLLEPFDTIHKFHNWSGQPLDVDDQPVQGIGGGWVLRIAVVHVRHDDPSVTSVPETGVKRVTVQVSKNGVDLVQRQALRTRYFDEIGAEQ